MLGNLFLKFQILQNIVIHPPNNELANFVPERGEYQYPEEYSYVLEYGANNSCLGIQKLSCTEDLYLETVHEKVINNETVQVVNNIEVCKLPVSEEDIGLDSNTAVKTASVVASHLCDEIKVSLSTSNTDKNKTHIFI